MAALLLGACGVPSDSSPRVIARKDLPAALAGTSTTLGHPAGVLTQERIFLVRNAGTNPSLEAMWVDVPFEPSTVDQVRAVLDVLISDMPQTDKNKDLTNAIPSSVRIRSAHLHQGVLSLDLSQLTLENPELRLAFAQLVYTATDLRGIDSVRFAVQGQPAQVPLDRSTSRTGEPVDRSDFRQLGPNS
jgi:hypothetical protein